MEVQVQSRKLIVPSTPTPHHLRNFKISSIDALQNTQVPMEFFYSSNANEHDPKTTERSKLLQKSLAQTLTFFYPLAGRFIKERLMIDCNDDGAEYLEAKVSGMQLSQLINREIDTNLVDQLVPLRFTWSNEKDFHLNMLESATRPLLVVQVNVFDCGGLAIGLCFSHRIGDAFTMLKFVDTWATFCREGIDDDQAKERRPEFQFASLYPAREFTFEASGFSTLLRRVVTKRLVFDRASLTHLKSKSKRQTSRVKMVIALIWRALMKVNQAKHGHLRPCVLFSTMNLRGKITLPVDEDSCGNIINAFLTRFVPNDHQSSCLQVELHDLVDLLDDALSKNIKHCAQLDAEHLYLTTIDAIKKASDELCNGEADFYMYSSWCNFPLYGADFGWGKPIWVSCLSPPAEFILLMDTPCGDGIEAWVSLRDNDMPLFLHDPDISAFIPKYST